MPSSARVQTTNTQHVSPYQMTNKYVEIIVWCLDGCQVVCAAMIISVQCIEMFGIIPLHSWVSYCIIFCPTMGMLFDWQSLTIKPMSFELEKHTCFLACHVMQWLEYLLFGVLISLHAWQNHPLGMVFKAPFESLRKGRSLSWCNFLFMLVPYWLQSNNNSHSLDVASVQYTLLHYKACCKYPLLWWSVLPTYTVNASNNKVILQQTQNTLILSLMGFNGMYCTNVTAQPM